MKEYEFLPHTADAKFKAYGKTLEEAFTNAAYAMTDVITDHKKVKPTVEKTISASSEDLKALLYDFLEQFLILLDSEGFILNKVKELKIEKNKPLKIFAKVVGDTELKNYEIDTNIKAVTYQEMLVEEKEGRCMVQVIVDI